MSKWIQEGIKQENKAIEKSKQTYEADKLLGLAADLDMKVPHEMYHFIKVMIYGVKKHGTNNWLLPNGNKADHKSMHASMFRHLAESSCGKRTDEETGLDPLLHLVTRALMVYTRKQRGLDNPAPQTDSYPGAAVLPEGE